MSKLILAILGVFMAWCPARAGEGWHFGTTGLGLSQYFLSPQVPAGIATGKSNPWGIGLSQEFYAGRGFRTRLVGDLAWENEEESCFFICMDYNMIGRYFWKTQYAAVGLRISPDNMGFLNGIGLGLGYSRFRYHWGIAKRGWDSEYPSGQFLSGTYVSHQANAGVDYTFSFRKRCWGFSLTLGLQEVLASRNTFRPLLATNTDTQSLAFPEHPLGATLSLKLEL